MTTERDPQRQDRIMDAAEDLTSVWRDLGPNGRRMVNEHVGRDLYKALHALAIEVEERVPLKTIMDDAETEGEAEPVGYPAEKRVADLERFLAERNVRENALHHARKTWEIGFDSEHGPHEHARNVTTLARAFERYLTDGTVHEVPTITEIDDEETTP